MILSHKHKFIFVKTEKTAGTSLEIALSKFCGPKDIITPIAVEDEEMRKKLGFRSAQNYKMTLGRYMQQSNSKKLQDMIEFFYKGRYPHEFWNHIPASQIKKLINKELWDNYTKFTIIREPVDQTISNYVWVYNRYNQNENLESISSYIRTRSDRLRNNWNIVSEKGEFILDYAIRYEYMHRDADEIGRNIGLPESLSELLKNIRAKSGYSKKGQSKEEIVNDEDIRVIRYLRKEEIECFRY